MLFADKLRAISREKRYGRKIPYAIKERIKQLILEDADVTEWTSITLPIELHIGPARTVPKNIQYEISEFIEMGLGIYIQHFEIGERGLECVTILWDRDPDTSKYEKGSWYRNRCKIDKDDF